MNFFDHESAYRGGDAVERLGLLQVVVCGVGALGSILVDNLVRQGVRRLTVIDDDRVEAHNLGTQIYRQEDVGAAKVAALRAHIFRAVGVEIEAVFRRLDDRNVKKLLRGAGLVVDAFDNSLSRGLVTRYCAEAGLNCIHLGMNAGYGEVCWNANYRVPGDVPVGDACATPLARNLILLTVAAGSEAILRFALENRRQDMAITLRDLRISVEDID